MRYVKMDGAFLVKKGITCTICELETYRAKINEFRGHGPTTI